MLYMNEVNRFFNAGPHLLDGLFQRHAALHHRLGLFSVRFFALLSVNRFEHLSHQLHLGTKRENTLR